MRTDLVDEALDQAEVLYPTADLGLRARWRRGTSPDGEVLGYELTVHVPDHHDRPQATRAHAPAGDT
jgi:hypothetical protein